MYQFRNCRTCPFIRPCMDSVKAYGDLYLAECNGPTPERPKFNTQEQVYRHLLDCGPATVSELVATSEVGESAIRRAILLLRKQGRASTQTVKIDTVPYHKTVYSAVAA